MDKPRAAYYDPALSEDEIKALGIDVDELKHFVVPVTVDHALKLDVERRESAKKHRSIDDESVTGQGEG